MKLAWDKWAYGLVSGFIGGGSGAVVGGVTSALMFKVDVTTWAGASRILTLMLIQFVVAGAFSMFFYLKQSPLPPATDTTTITRTDVTTVKISQPQTTEPKETQ
jgi:hypothetical protein